MTTWRPFLLVAVILSALTVSCAQGGAVLSADAAVGTGTGVVSLCGNGVIDKGESCDCGPGNAGKQSCPVADPTQTCMKLQNTGGTLLCSVANGMFDTTACLSTATAGAGTSGTGG